MELVGVGIIPSTTKVELCQRCSWSMSESGTLCSRISYKLRLFKTLVRRGQGNEIGSVFAYEYSPEGYLA